MENSKNTKQQIVNTNGGVVNNTVSNSNQNQEKAAGFNVLNESLVPDYKTALTQALPTQSVDWSAPWYAQNYNATPQAQYGALQNYYQQDPLTVSVNSGALANNAPQDTESAPMTIPANATPTSVVNNEPQTSANADPASVDFILPTTRENEQAITKKIEASMPKPQETINVNGEEVPIAGEKELSPFATIDEVNAYNSRIANEAYRNKQLKDNQTEKIEEAENFLSQYAVKDGKAYEKAFGKMWIMTDPEAAKAVIKKMGTPLIAAMVAGATPSNWTPEQFAEFGQTGQTPTAQTNLQKAGNTVQPLNAQEVTQLKNAGDVLDKEKQQKEEAELAKNIEIIEKETGLKGFDPKLVPVLMDSIPDIQEYAIFSKDLANGNISVDGLELANDSLGNIGDRYVDYLESIGGRLGTATDILSTMDNRKNKSVVDLANQIVKDNGVFAEAKTGIQSFLQTLKTEYPDLPYSVLATVLGHSLKNDSEYWTKDTDLARLDKDHKLVARDTPLYTTLQSLNGDEKTAGSWKYILSHAKRVRTMANVYKKANTALATAKASATAYLKLLTRHPTIYEDPRDVIYQTREQLKAKALKDAEAYQKIVANMMMTTLTNTRQQSSDAGKN